MKLKTIKFGVVVSILVSFVMSIGGTAFACLSPFTMNVEKTLMKCAASEPPPAPIADSSDKNCKDSLFKDGQIHHVNSSSHILVLKDFQMFSTSWVPSTGIPVEDPLLHGFFLQDRFPHVKYSSTPLYTFHHSFLI